MLARSAHRISLKAYTDGRLNAIGGFMEEQIKKDFNIYLGMPFEEMGRMGQLIYAPDYEIFKAGFEAAMAWLTTSSSGSSTTA